MISDHPSAAKSKSRLTSVFGLIDGTLCWVGALDESMLKSADSPPGESPRSMLTPLLFRGERVGKIVRPGGLLPDDAPPSTVYRGQRPWVILAEHEQFGLLSAPLNDAGMGDPRPYQVFIEEDWLALPERKRSNVELLHMWSFPANLKTKGHVKKHGMAEIQTVAGDWYR